MTDFESQLITSLAGIDRTLVMIFLALIVMAFLKLLD